jgi:hypothetical protein
MVSATHNHAGPAVANVGESRRDEAYLAWLVDRVADAFCKADAALRPARVGVASGMEHRISFNRRYVTRDGRVVCHPRPGSPDMLRPEGVIDPELGVLCASDPDGPVLGLVTNWACHPTHYGASGAISAGYPCALSRQLRARLGDGVINVFLNGACGNIHHSSPADPEQDDSPERMGAVLAEDVVQILASMEFSDSAALAAKSDTLRLMLRPVSESDLKPHARSQRFADDDVYRRSILRLMERRERRDHVLAELQVIRVGDAVFAAVPAEYFAELGLRIKLESPARRAFVVTCANGMVGYVPHKAAFEGGGYETTLAEWSKLVPEAGDIMADAALRLIAELVGQS